MEPLVDRTVSFRDVLTSPESYKGRVLVLGGEVLKAKRLRDSTQIELLQRLPNLETAIQRLWQE